MLRWKDAIIIHALTHTNSIAFLIEQEKMMVIGANLEEK